MERQDEANPPIGAGSFQAWMRQGLKEARAIFYPESNVAQPTEHGMYGTVTPGEVRDQREDAIRDPGEDKSSVLAEREQQAETRAKEQERDSKDLQRE